MPSFVRLLLAAASLLGLALTATAQAPFPSQPVRMVVPFSAGSMTDILARAVSEKLAQKWGQQVIVENRPGLPGTSGVAKATPDGHTLMLTSNGHTIIGALNTNLNFDPIADFAPVSQVANVPLVLVVPPTSGAKTLQALIADAKARPGALNYASAGVGSTTGLAGHLLRNVTGTDMVHVPHKGLPEANTSVLRGDTQMGFTVFSVGGDLIQSGQLPGVAVTGNKRLAPLPDIPTFAEAGLADFNYDSWFGIMAPGGTPKALVDKISADIAEALNGADMKARFEPIGVFLSPSKPDAFAAQIKSDAERFAKILPKAAPAK